MSERLKSGVPLDEVLVNYENHREKYAERRREVAKGWSEHLYKNEQNFDPVNPYYLNKTYEDKYNMHNSEEVITDIPYWDTKANDAYYSLPRYKRLQLYIQDKVNFSKYKDFLLLNLFLMLILIYYANKKSKQIIL